MITALTGSNTPFEDGIYLIGISIYTQDGLFVESHVGEAEIRGDVGDPYISDYVSQITTNYYARWKLDFITKIGDLK